MEVGESPSFGGWHVQTSYVFGGSRSYSGGIFGGVRPEGEAGAWEIAARFSTMDLNDSGYHGGEQSNFTVALNRYVTSNLRFMFNVIFVDVEDRNPILGVMRAQFHF